MKCVLGLVFCGRSWAMHFRGWQTYS